MKNSSITIKQIAKELNVTERVIERHLKILKNKQVITRFGSRKKGSWTVSWY